MSDRRIVVGTSSWADPGFVEEWYPQGLPARDRLAWYAERFAWDYSEDELAEPRGRAEGLAEEAGSVRMTFNDNRGADAPKAAERMKELLGS